MLRATYVLPVEADGMPESCQEAASPTPPPARIPTGKFPSIPTLHAIEAYGFLAGFSMCFSLGFDNALRWVFNRSSLGFHKGPIHRFSQVCCRFFHWVSLMGFAGFLQWIPQGSPPGFWRHVQACGFAGKYQ